MDKRIALEMAVSGELTKLRLIERALHDHEAGWAVQVGTAKFPARVELTDHGVEFIAEAHRPVHGSMSLWIDGMPVSPTSEHEVEAETGELLTWALTMGSLARA